MTRREREQRRRILDARIVSLSIAWWRSRRPISWTQAEHIKNPTVNTATRWDHDLAREVAFLVVSMETQEPTP